MTAPLPSRRRRAGSPTTRPARRRPIWASRSRTTSPPPRPLCPTPAVGRGLAVGDIDGDGAPDLLLPEIGRPAHLLLNRVPNRGHWLLIRAVDPKLKRDAYGAMVTVTAGGRSQVRHVLAAGSYQSSSDPRVHFGLGSVDHVDSIQLRWPGGDEESFPGGAANRFIE